MTDYIRPNTTGTILPHLTKDGFEIDSPNDLLCRKELLVNKAVKQDITASKDILTFPIKIDIDDQGKKHLSLQTYQAFSRNFMVPQSPYWWLVLYYGTGVGKTLTALSIASNYIEQFEIIYKHQSSKIFQGNIYLDKVDKTTPRVIIIGIEATKKMFTKELLSRPEFGLVSTDEYIELERLRKIADTNKDEISERNYRQMKSQFKQRIGNKLAGGYYSFYGYKELVNKLFTATKEESIAELVHEKLTSAELDTLISSGKIKVDHAFLQLFRHSMIITDEFHEMYNSNGLNLRGHAIKYIIQQTRKKHSIRWVATSATPFTNSPKEAVYMINISRNENEQLDVNDLFDSDGNLKSGAVEIISAATNGHVSYMQDNSTINFPKRVIMGEPVRDLPYLKFISCPTTDIHLKAIKTIEDPNKIMSNSNNIFDMTFPDISDSNNSIFTTDDIRSKIMVIDKKTLMQNNIEVTDGIIGGTWLRKDNIKRYSSKMEKLLTLCETNIKEKLGKTLIYHRKVHGAGVKLLGNMLMQNGYVLYGTSTTNSSLCKECYIRYDEHEKFDHEFEPIYFYTLHNSVDKNTMDRIIQIWNDEDNMHGKYLHFILGSNLIMTGYTLLDTRNLFVVSLTDNISMLLQLFGRAIRNRSHERLPPELRQVQIYILLTTIPNEISPEEYRYKSKLNKYKNIQLIERGITKYAIDGDLYRDMIMTPEKLREYFGDSSVHTMETAKNVLGMLYYEPYYTSDKCSKSPELLTFTTHNHYRNEIILLTYIIKRLYYTDSVHTYDSLLASVRNPPFRINVNSSLFSEGNFAIALSLLVHEHSKIKIVDMTTQHTDFTYQEEIDKLFDREDKYIYKHGVKHTIKQIDKYYILFPVLINHDIPHDDVETYLRNTSKQTKLVINLRQVIDNLHLDKSYNLNLQQLLSTKYDRLIDIFTEFDSNFHKKLIERYIENETDLKKHKIINDVIDLYSKLDLLVYDNNNNNKLIGYVNKLNMKAMNKLVMLYENKKWIASSISTKIKYKLNNIILGYYEFISKPQFKLRPVVVDLEVGDKRLIEKGSVCSSKRKSFLENILKQLNVKIHSDRVMDICYTIESELMRREIHERQINSDIKYMIVW